MTPLWDRVWLTCSLEFYHKYQSGTNHGTTSFQRSSLLAAQPQLWNEVNYVDLKVVTQKGIITQTREQSRDPHIYHVDAIWHIMTRPGNKFLGNATLSCHFKPEMIKSKLSLEFLPFDLLINCLSKQKTFKCGFSHTSRAHRFFTKCWFFPRKVIQILQYT